MPTPITRYAPSPTGDMHLGNARTALLCWLHARARGARHLLRFEDLDRSRVRPHAYDSIRRDLEWLGLTWDAEFTQSERLELYQQALERLDTYPCTCSRREVQEAASAPHTLEPIYPGTCLGQPLKPGVPPALRWRLPAGRVGFVDPLLGPLEQDLALEVGDFVLRRGDGVFAYHLAVTVDDGLMGVTDIVRGADLWTSTPRQIALQSALGFPTPDYWHVPLMTDYHGQRLAKRHGAPPVAALREAGADPRRVLADLVRSLGWQDVPALELPEVLERFESGEFRLESLILNPHGMGRSRHPANSSEPS